MTRAADQSERKNRIPFMLSDGELTAIDDWRFANRIGSRAEAIRLLVAAALTQAEERR